MTGNPYKPPAQIADRVQDAAWPRLRGWLCWRLGIGWSQSGQTMDSDLRVTTTWINKSTGEIRETIHFTG